jgi:hypothetical protein
MSIITTAHRHLARPPAPPLALDRPHDLARQAAPGVVAGFAAGLVAVAYRLAFLIARAIAVR